jgi:hypothetical protein
MTEEMDLQRKTNSLAKNERTLFDEMRESLTEKQFIVLEKFFEIEAIPNTITDLTGMLGISRVSWYNWLKDPAFRSCLYMVGQARFAADDPFVNQILADKARAGEIGAIRLLKELTGAIRV